jgi:hypothetical protein
VGIWWEFGGNLKQEKGKTGKKWEGLLVLSLPKFGFVFTKVRVCLVCGICGVVL